MSETEEIVFWDEFAEEYTEIADESQLPIAADLASYLVQQHILPTNHFVDLACGSGRYISALLPVTKKYSALDFSKEMLRIASKRFNSEKLTFCLKSQQEFFKEKSFYEVIFTAMNPALAQKKDLFDLLKKGNTILILRMIQETDDVFQPYEHQQENLLMIHYKTWLLEKNIPFRSKKFVYHTKEEVNRDFFYAYFKEDFSSEKLSVMMNKVFGRHNIIISNTEVVYELLVIQPNKDNAK